ncbi:hypothetical protein A2U01_0090782, partial [Trifolium medium]|nr:hypothetical protein [Trifolium medium]
SRSETFRWRDFRAFIANLAIFAGDYGTRFRCGFLEEISLDLATFANRRM